MEVNTSGTLRGPVTHEATVEFIHVADQNPVLELLPEMTPEEELTKWKEYAARLEARCSALNTYASDLADQVNELDAKVRAG